MEMKATSASSTFVNSIYAKTAYTEKYYLNVNGIRDFFFTLTILKERILGLKNNWLDMGL